MHRSYLPEVTDTTACPGVRAAYRQLAELMRKDTWFGATAGNTVTLIPEGSQKWELLRRDIAKARKSIYLDMYLFHPDSTGRILAEMLREKARDGVDVRIILDRHTDADSEREALAGLLADSVALHFMHLPVHRDHRKIVLLDGETAYVGGRNLKDAEFLAWRDADLRITGAAVADLSAVYRENQQRVAPHLGPVYVAEDLPAAARADVVSQMKQFTDVTVQIVPESPADKVLPIRNCFEWALENARRYFWFYNPYAPPPATTLKALRAAVARGVDVRWIVPAVNDVRVEKWMGESLYRELLEAGVRIFEWQGEMMHAKQFMTDDYLLGIGSANMDNLSFFVNFEIEALVYDEDATRHAVQQFLADLEDHCQEITQEAVRKWSVFRKFRNRVTRKIAGPLG